MQTQKEPPKLEVIDDEIEFMFRLVSADGKRKTFWGTYTDAVYLDGYCGVTNYYGFANNAESPRVITAEEFLTLVCVGVTPNAN